MFTHLLCKIHGQRTGREQRLFNHGTAGKRRAIAKRAREHMTVVLEENSNAGIAKEILTKSE